MNTHMYVHLHPQRQTHPTDADTGHNLRHRVLAVGTNMSTHPHIPSSSLNQSSWEGRRRPRRNTQHVLGHRPPPLKPLHTRPEVTPTCAEHRSPEKCQSSFQAPGPTQALSDCDAAADAGEAGPAPRNRLLRQSRSRKFGRLQIFGHSLPLLQPPGLVSPGTTSSERVVTRSCASTASRAPARAWPGWATLLPTSWRPLSIRQASAPSCADPTRTRGHGAAVRRARRAPRRRARPPARPPRPEHRWHGAHPPDAAAEPADDHRGAPGRAQRLREWRRKVSSGSPSFAGGQLRGGLCGDCKLLAV